MVKNRLGFLVFAGVGAVLIVSSLAWACTPQAYVLDVPGHAAAGQVIQIAGRGFENAGVANGTSASVPPVKIYWNQAGGQELGQASSGSFSQNVTIPAGAKPGVYTIVAAQGALDSSYAKAVDVIEVTGAGPIPSARSASSDLWGGLSSQALIPGQASAAPEASSSTSTALALGAALAGFGFAAMATLGIAAIRRRRTPAPTTS